MGLVLKDRCSKEAEVPVKRMSPVSRIAQQVHREERRNDKVLDRY